MLAQKGRSNEEIFFHTKLLIPLHSVVNSKVSLVQSRFRNSENRKNFARHLVNKYLILDSRKKRKKKKTGQKSNKLK